LNIRRLYYWVGRHFRRKRMTRFSQLFDVNSKTRILDIGGTPTIWHFLEKNPQVVLLNISELNNEKELRENMSFVLGDGRSLKFEDQSYDIAYSNSVIEHVGTYEDQQSFAREIKRVGKGLFVQTPAREFPLEPHYLTPFVHWFPISIQRRLLRNFTLWGLLARPTDDDVERVLSEIRLLNKREFSELFDGCQIFCEKILFFTKSYIAYRPIKK
jgi:hypothetical protein